VTYDPKTDAYFALCLCLEPEPVPQEKIKAHYRLMAKTYHPDRNEKPGAEDMFKRAAAAYEILGDPLKRAEYDSARKAYRLFQRWK
jgi:DnaJ-class molecular chaperone